MRVLGIDPGLRITGYGCVETRERQDQITLIEAGVFKLIHGSDKRPVIDRLLELDADLSSLLDRVNPDVVAVESLFAHYKHPTTAITMGHARGVILLAIRKAQIPLVELKPTEVKKSLLGFGHASKSQMQAGVQAALSLAELPTPADMADAIAIAMCAAHRQGCVV
ncbi:MAG: crossover junction endodeoxyribonuclease RuvC [Phycisphaeraceae bacterium]|nr:crossover junction endodeoxyribonuclease RuvC [Phycisphaerales bacterium]MCB9861037.1 crossover junction endodeoxyribonuclease RuvC [Phycisphaeraceae bacterium]